MASSHSPMEEKPVDTEESLFLTEDEASESDDDTGIATKRGKQDEPDDTGDFQVEEPEIELPDVLFETQVHDKNDFAVGALPRDVPSQRPSFPAHSPAMCYDSMDAQLWYMPFKVVTKAELLHTKPFKDASVWMPDNFLTTWSGVQKAIAAAQARRTDDTTKDEWLEMLMAEVYLRSGYPPASHEMCGRLFATHPEDIIPYVDEDSPDFDSEFWAEMKANGEIWNEVDFPGGLAVPRIGPK